VKQMLVELEQYKAEQGMMEESIKELGDSL
jgi:hypothetical protein